MVKGLVLFDYDGTLVDERANIFEPTKATRETIAKLQVNGYLCMLATGRALCYIPKVVNNLHLDGYITCNGANVVVHGKEIYTDVFDDDELKTLITYMSEEHINFILESNANCYVKDLEDEHYLHFMNYFKVPNEHFISYESRSQVEGTVAKITLVFKDRAALDIAKNKLSKQYQCCVHRNCNTLDIGKKTIHKGTGALVVMDHFTIAKADTYAFGDGDNDVELLRSVQHGIAMELHHEDLDEVASMVTDSVANEGIQKALRKLEVI